MGHMLTCSRTATAIIIMVDLYLQRLVMLSGKCLFSMVLQKIAYLILTTAPLGYEGRYYYFNFTHQEVQAQGREVNGPFGTGARCTVGLGTQPPHSRSQTNKKLPHNRLPFY